MAVGLVLQFEAIKSEQVRGRSIFCWIIHRTKGW
jgi:hypothetical protein